MSDKKLYEDYFAIDPNYYAAVDEELIKTGKVKWEFFYPHETFVKLLEKTHIMLSGRDSRSLWVEGAYGVGKSHAALTIKSLLEAEDNKIRAYFQNYGLNMDLCQKLITDKNSGKLITIHRIGSAAIRSDQDLILAMQDSISAALKAHGITNRGETSLRDAALKWLEEKDANRNYFDSLIKEEKYMWTFGGNDVEHIITTLRNSDNPEIISKMMRNILQVAEDNGITALRLDVPAMCEWIKSVIKENNISAILFVWDEFTEYFQNNQNSLTGFQTLVQLSASTPFYFLIVTHEAKNLIIDDDMRKKILNRFVGDVAVRIEIPDNIAFRLLAKAMKVTSDPVLEPEWQEYKVELNEELINVRNTIINNVKKQATLGSKTLISDEDLQSVVPIHPYAALLLKHMSVVFNSNARSMFDFVISNDMEDAKGFKYFIRNYGPLEDNNLLTIDMLWDFFTCKNQNGLNDDVRTILGALDLLPKNALLPDQVRVFKTVLLFEAVSLRVNNVDLLRPNEQNIDLAFSGTDWNIGKARSIAFALCEQGFLFEKPVGGGMREYTVANKGGNKAKIEEYRKQIRESVRTQDLIVTAELMNNLKLPASISARYVIEPATAANFTVTLNKVKNNFKANRLHAIVTFALNDNEAAIIGNHIMKAVHSSENIFFIESLVPFGNDLLTQYVDNMAYSKNYAQSNKQQANGYANEAKKCLDEWRQKIFNGAFMLYTAENKSGIRVRNFDTLCDELKNINRQIYYYGVEQFNLIDNMFAKSQLAQGAECGINQELKSTYRSANKNTSLDTALKDVWQVEKYWEDPQKKSLSIVKIKQKVEQIIREGFDNSAGRVSIMKIYETLEDVPFGFLPNNVTAFILGFVLKEYANSNYFWSNDSTAESMSVEKMKQMIANVINQKFSPSAKYKNEYIVEMGENMRCFLQCTSKAFHIPAAQCGSVESARNQVRIAMKNLIFPIWTLKYILDVTPLESSAEKIAGVIDSYCGVANTANSTKSTESELAEYIGSLVHEDSAITADLSKLLNNDMCRKGMLAYIAQFQGGILKKLAAEIKDNGAYLEQVKQKFNSDAANWVWSVETADERIADVILEYQIILESNKSLPRCTNLRDVILEWGKRSNNIKIPYDILKKYVGDLKIFLEQIYYIKQSGQLQEQNKQKFYDELVAQRENFDRFYKEQLNYFNQAVATFVDELEEQDIAEFFKTIPAGQFTKSSTEYYQYVERTVTEYKKNLKKSRLKNLWLEKTGTKDPVDWSERYETPILCMFDDAERKDAKEIFTTILAYAASDSNIGRAISYLEAANFYDRLNDAAERESCFMARVVGDYSVMLKDIDFIRKKLKENISEKVFDWMDNSTVKNRLKILAEKQYKLNGYERVQAVIDKMDAGELRRYLNELISDNLTVGMEILKKE